MKIVFKSFANNRVLVQMTNVDDNVTGLLLKAYTNKDRCNIIMAINNTEFLSIKVDNIEEVENYMNLLYDLICTNRLLDSVGSTLHDRRPEVIKIVDMQNGSLNIIFKYGNIKKNSRYYEEL